MRQPLQSVFSIYNEIRRSSCCKSITTEKHTFTFTVFHAFFLYSSFVVWPFFGQSVNHFIIPVIHFYLEDQRYYLNVMVRGGKKIYMIWKLDLKLSGAVMVGEPCERIKRKKQNDSVHHILYFVIWTEVGAWIGFFMDRLGLASRMVLDRECVSGSEPGD